MCTLEAGALRVYETAVGGQPSPDPNPNDIAADVRSDPTTSKGLLGTLRRSGSIVSELEGLATPSCVLGAGEMAPL